MESIRCGKCARLLAKADAYAELELKCPRCGAFTILRAARPDPERLERPTTKDDPCRIGKPSGR